MRSSRLVNLACALPLFLSSIQAHAASVEKRFKEYMALTPDHFQKTASIKDDDLEVTATITTEPGYQIKNGLLHLVNDDYFFRAFVDKKTGEAKYQLYEYMTYVGEWANFETVNYEAFGGLTSAPLDVLSREVGSCNQFVGCFKREVVAFTVDEQLLRALAAMYDPTGKGTAGWRFRLKAKSGAQRDEGMAPAEAAGILNAVAAYRKTHGLPLGEAHP